MKFSAVFAYTEIWIGLGIVAGLALIGLIIFFLVRRSRPKPPVDTPKAPPQAPPGPEIGHDSIAALAEYVRLQKQQAEAEAELKALRKADLKQKLEVFKQTKEQLKDKLKDQIDQKAWKPLESILRSADKGGTGIYIVHNATKNKYYVGQAKQLYKRVRDHFIVEDMARDYMAGDAMQVKFLTANELDADYRLDHIEKTGIEIFDADKSGYNKTIGNL